MAGLVLTKTRFRGGVWEGLLTGAGAAPPRLVLRHRDETLPGPDVTPGQDAFLVHARVPADRIADGLQTFVIATADDAAVLASFAIYAGEDVAEGAALFAPGQRIEAPEIALLSATGVSRVTVHRRLSVGVLSTGDEIAQPGEPAAAHRTYDANRPMLLTLLEDWRMTPEDLGHIEDDRALLAARLDDAADRVDAILTTGGASAGDEDHLSALLGERGARQDWRIALTVRTIGARRGRAARGRP